MKYFVFSLFCMLALFACSESEVIEPEKPKPYQASYSFWAGTKSLVEVYMDPADYILGNSDPTVASVRYDKSENVLIVNTHRVGDTTVTLTGEEGEVAVTLTIHSCYWEAGRILEGENEFIKAEVLVDCEDANIRKDIQKELRQYIDNKKEMTYTFDAASRTFTMKAADSDEVQHGTYSWNIDSLALDYNGVHEEFAFQFTKTQYCYFIVEDKTETYRALFPDAGIVSVKVQRVWFEEASYP